MDRRITFPLLLVIVITIGAFTSTADSANGQNICSGNGCHGSRYYQYLTILPEHEDSAIPEVMDLNESHLMALTLENSCSHSDPDYDEFDWIEITLTFDSDSISASREVIRSGELRPGTRTYYVTLTCNRVEPVIVTVDAVGHNPHENVRATDSYTFSINSVIDVSTYKLDPAISNTTIELVANEDVDRVEVNLSAGLEGNTNITPMNITNLPEAAPVGISILFLDPSAEGAINFTWKAGNRTGTVTVTVSPPPDTGGTSDGKAFVLVGRITGILSFILLLISTVLCLNIKSWKTFVIRKLGKRRIPLHCYVSYSIVATSLIHLVSLLAKGKYSSSFQYGVLMTGSNRFFYNIGHIALIMMVLLGLTGIYQKRMMGYFKRKGYIPYATWRLIHLTLTIIALVLVIAHMIKIGSDFTWLG